MKSSCNKYCPQICQFCTLKNSFYIFSVVLKVIKKIPVTTTTTHKNKYMYWLNALLSIHTYCMFTVVCLVFRSDQYLFWLDLNPDRNVLLLYLGKNSIIWLIYVYVRILVFQKSANFLENFYSFRTLGSHISVNISFLPVMVAFWSN